MAVVAPQLSQLSQLSQLNQLNQDGHQVRGVKLDNFTRNILFAVFFNSQHKGYVRPNMCLQISNSCHTQVTLSSRPFNIGQKFKSPNFFHPNISFSGTTQPFNLIFCEKISLPKSGWSTSVMNKRLQGKP